MRVAWWAVLFVACAGDGRYAVVLRAPAGATVERAEVDVVPACLGVAVDSGEPPASSLRHVEVLGRERAEAIGSLAAGRYGLYARAWDARCRLFAAGCHDFEVTGDGRGTIAVTLEPVDARGCDANETCRRARCVPTDELDASTDAGPLDGSIEADSGACGGDERESVFEIAEDSDDALWFHVTTDPMEELFFSEQNPFVFVSTDDLDTWTGLRFALDLPDCAEVTAARLRLFVSPVDHSYEASATMRVFAYASLDVPSFVYGHTEAPTSHDPAGVLPDSVGAWTIGPVGETTESPDLGVLLEAVMAAAGRKQGRIGFVLTPDTMGPNQWVGFGDFHGMDFAAELHVLWR